MVNIVIGRSDYHRLVAKEPPVALRNRYFEENPVLNQVKERPNQRTEFPALIARPGLKKFAEVGTGHIRFCFSAPGTFGDDAFVVSGLDLYRIDNAGTGTLIGTISNDVLGGVSMAATGEIGDGADAVPAYLFITDGAVLWVYTENGSAIGHLEASGTISNAETVVIDGVYYAWTNASVDAGTPAGTIGSPWLVELGASASASLSNLYYAVNAGGGAGTTYSTALTAHPTVAATIQSGSDLYVAARLAGTAGNSIAVSETGANLAWTAATLAGGGAAQLRQVGMPNDVGAISVAHFNSYILVVPVQGMGVNGRFYWIEPGETFVDPLSFATAERSPDAVNQVVSLSDRFWLLGQSSSEAWVTTGDLLAPMIRMSGVLYEQGARQGTAVVINNTLILVDQNGDVQVIGGSIETVSTPDIAEAIREGIAYQQTYSV